MSQTIHLHDIYEEVKKIERNMITKEEMNRFIETMEILSNEETMVQIKKSEQDIKIGKVKEITSVRDL